MLENTTQSKPGKLDKDECEALKVMDISNLGINNLEGIERFVNLNKLVCDNNAITSLNLTRNQLLSHISLSNNKLSNIDLSRCGKLKYLYLSNNSLESLDITKNIEIVHLDIAFNNLKK